MGMHQISGGIIRLFKNTAVPVYRTEYGKPVIKKTRYPANYAAS